MMFERSRLKERHYVLMAVAISVPVVLGVDWGARYVAGLVDNYRIASINDMPGESNTPSERELVDDPLVKKTIYSD